MKMIEELQTRRERVNEETKTEIDRTIHNIYIEESGIHKAYLELLNEDILSSYFSSINSSIGRQINKLKVMKGSDVTELKKKFIRNIPYLFNTLDELFYQRGSNIEMLRVIQSLITIPKRTDRSYYEKIELDFKDFDDIKVSDDGKFEFGINRDKMKKLENCCHLLLCFVTEITSSFLDIFYITRVLQSKNPYLSIGYFGDNHTKNIRSFLIENLGYTILTKSDDIGVVIAENISRCITMNDTDLDDVLKVYLTKERKANAVRNIISLNIERRKRLESFEEAGVLDRLASGAITMNIKDELEIPEELLDY